MTITDISEEGIKAQRDRFATRICELIEDNDKLRQEIKHLKDSVIAYGCGAGDQDRKIQQLIDENKNLIKLRDLAYKAEDAKADYARELIGERDRYKKALEKIAYQSLIIPETGQILLWAREALKSDETK